MPGEGLEPSCPRGHPILSRARLTSSATPACRTLDLGSGREGGAREALGPAEAVLVHERVEDLRVEPRAGRDDALSRTRVLARSDVGRDPGFEDELVLQRRQRSDDDAVRIADVPVADLVDLRLGNPRAVLDDDRAVL